MATPKSIRIILCLAVLITLTIGICFTLGCCYGPSPAYVEKMDLRASLHFPRYKNLINNASIEQLESILGKNPGTLKKAKKEDIAFMKRALCKEVDAWHYLIKEEKKLLK